MEKVMAPSKKPGSMPSKRAPSLEASDEDIDELSPEQISMRLKKKWVDEALENKSAEELKEMLEEDYLNKDYRTYENKMRELSKRKRPEPHPPKSRVSFADQVHVSEFDTENPPNSEPTTRSTQPISDSSRRAQSKIQLFLTQLKNHLIENPQVIDSQEKKNEFITNAMAVAAASYGIEFEDDSARHSLEKKINQAITPQIEETPASPSETDFFNSIERTTSFSQSAAEPAQQTELEDFNSLQQVTSDSESESGSVLGSEDTDGEELEHAVAEEKSPLLRGSSFVGVRGLLRAKQTNPKETPSPTDSEPDEAAGEESKQETAPRPPTRGEAFSRLRFGSRLPQKEEEDAAHGLPTSRSHVSRTNSPDKK